MMTYSILLILCLLTSPLHIPAGIEGIHLSAQLILTLTESKELMLHFKEKKHRGERMASGRQSSAQGIPGLVRDSRFHWWQCSCDTENNAALLQHGLTR